jgi:hypothetical protein
MLPTQWHRNQSQIPALLSAQNQLRPKFVQFINFLKYF